MLRKYIKVKKRGNFTTGNFVIRMPLTTQVTTEHRPLSLAIIILSCASFLDFFVWPILPTHRRAYWVIVGLHHPQWHTHTHTLGRIPLDEGSAYLYLPTHNRQKFTTPAGLEPVIPTSDRPQTQRPLRSTQFFNNFTSTPADSCFRWRPCMQSSYLLRSTGPIKPRRTYRPLKMRTPRSLEKSGTNYPLARRHIPQERNPQLDRCENLKIPVINNSVI